MKALTVWQPWASLLAQGEKKYETRGWPTKYRGPIAIHAAARDPLKLPMTPGLEQYALHNDTIGSWLSLPTGAILAIGELVNVWHIVYHPGTDVDVAKHIDIGAESLSTDKHAPDFGDYFVPTEKELALGDWTPGRYAWEIKITELLEHPVAIKGKQGLWNWEALLLRYKGRDSWDRPVYIDENGKLWKDVDPLQDRPPKLCTALYNAFDGEPDTPMEYMSKYKDVQVVFQPERDTWKRRTNA